MWESYGVRDKKGRSRKEKGKKREREIIKNPLWARGGYQFQLNTKQRKTWEGEQDPGPFFFLLLLRQKLGNMNCAARSDEGSDGHAHHCTSGETGGRESERERERVCECTE